MLPLPMAFWPFTVAAGVNDALDLAVAGIPKLATVASGTYLTPDLLLSAVLSALQAQSALFTGVSAPGGIVSIAASSPVDLLFGTGANAAASLHRALGFTDADLLARSSFLAPRQHAGGWYSSEPATDDSGDLPVYERSQGRSLGGAVVALDHGRRYVREVSLGHLPEQKMLKAGELGGSPESLERLYEDGWGLFRWWPDAAAPGVYGDYALDAASPFKRERLSPSVPRYSQTIRMVSPSRQITLADRRVVDFFRFAETAEPFRSEALGSIGTLGFYALAGGAKPTLVAGPYGRAVRFAGGKDWMEGALDPATALAIHNEWTVEFTLRCATGSNWPQFWGIAQFSIFADQVAMWSNLHFCFTGLGDVYREPELNPFRLNDQQVGIMPDGTDHNYVLTCKPSSDGTTSTIQGWKDSVTAGPFSGQPRSRPMPPGYSGLLRLSTASTNTNIHFHGDLSEFRVSNFARVPGEFLHEEAPPSM